MISIPNKHRFSRHDSLSFLLIVLITSLVCTTVTGAETKVAFQGDPFEYTEDKDGDGLAEYLVLDVPIKVYESGSYGLYGSIGSGAVTANSKIRSLPVGTHSIILRFPGNELRNYPYSGNYRIELEIFSIEPGEATVTRSYVTNESYSYDRFETPLDSQRTSVEIRNREVLIISPRMEVSVNKTAPILRFSYTGDLKRSSLTSLSYDEIIAFDDRDGDGLWTEGVDLRKYSASLLNGVDWTMDLDVQSGYSIDLTAVVQLRMADSPTVSAWGEVRFSLDSRSINPEGTSQKFDIYLDLYQPIDADYIALRNHLMDLSGKQKIAQRDDVPGATYALHMIGEDGASQAVYSWNNEILVGVDDADRISSANSSFVITDSQAEIWFSYPLYGERLHVYHDPTVGIENYEISEEENLLDNRPLVMAGGIAIGIFIVGGSLLVRYFQRGQGTRYRKGGG